MAIKQTLKPYVGKLVSLRKNRAVTNGPLCTKKLAGKNLTYRPVADKNNAKGCKVTNAIRLSKVGGVQLSRPAVVTCEMAVNPSDWIEDSVQPAAKAAFGHEVTQVNHLGSYNCRNMRGSPTRLSQHAFANAFDVAGFQLNDGKRLVIKHEWDNKGKEQQFWRSIRTRACRNFDLVLSPDFDKRHKDHLHLDAGPYKRCL